ncbi:MAG: DUF4330 family protein [Clostridia bacterium]|nr:DUF4330 family protein [Oscillospiraceae bacterium]MBQ6701478.1 DUF4330 family protein [Clostridia bacterium]
MSSVNKNRRKYRFNIVDILLLLIIVVSVAGILFLYFFDGSVGADEKKNETVDIIFTLSQTEVPDILRGKVNIGDSVTAADGGNELGEVTDTEYTDSVYTGYDSENNVTFEELYPGKIDVKIRVSESAIKGEDGLYRVNGYVLTPGQTIEVRFPYYTGEMVCTSISEVSKK